MKTVFITLFVLFSFIGHSYAKTEGRVNVTIEAISTHNGGENTLVVLALSDGTYAYIASPTHKHLHAISLAAFMGGKTMTIYRYKAEVSTPLKWWAGPGLPGNGVQDVYRIHRIDVKR